MIVENRLLKLFKICLWEIVRFLFLFMFFGFLNIKFFGKMKLFGFSKIIVSRLYEMFIFW